MSILQSPSFLPSCILAGVGLIFVVLAATLPPGQVFALVCGSAVAVGLVLARLRREMTEGASAMMRSRVEPGLARRR
jgi:hypothetical protein